MHPPEEFQTERLTLRRSRGENAEAVFANYATDPEVTRYLVWQPHENIEETREHLSRMEAAWDVSTVFTWAIFLEDELIGGLALRPEGYRAVIGYVLARSHWGRGYAAEALRPIVDWALIWEGIHRVWAVHDIDNPASGRVMEKAGMRREGVLRRWVRHPNISDTPRDCVAYAKIRE